MSSFLIGRPTTPVFLCAVVSCVSFISRGECLTTLPPTLPPTKPPPSTPCSAYKFCDTCVPHAHCLWCFSTNNCTDYPVSWLLPPASLCPLSQARWGVCWMNFEALIITLGVLAGVIILSIIACCCCCCCCRKSHPVPDGDEERYTRKREENKQRSEERKGERRAKHEEIRRKYAESLSDCLDTIIAKPSASNPLFSSTVYTCPGGLIGDSDHPYSKFENE